MKTTELFVEQTLTGFLVLTAGAAPFLSWENLQNLPDEAKGGIDISSAAGAIGAAYLLGVIFDRFADTLLERVNRWNRLLFAIELKEENKALSPDDPFPEDRLRSEEHTSELQSQSNLVCRLLLEKKNDGTASNGVAISEIVV